MQVKYLSTCAIYALGRSYKLIYCRIINKNNTRPVITPYLLESCELITQNSHKFRHQSFTIGPFRQLTSARGSNLWRSAERGRAAGTFPDTLHEQTPILHKQRARYPPSCESQTLASSLHQNTSFV